MNQLGKSLWFLAGAITAALALHAGGLAAQQRVARMKPGEKIRINPAGMFKPTSYSHVVIAQPGRIVHLAGQVAFNEKGEVVGKGDLRAQATQVMQNLENALKAAGATWDDVVKVNTYVVNYSADALPILREVRARFITGQNLPASTLIGIPALAQPDLLIEIEVVAVIP